MDDIKFWDWYINEIEQSKKTVSKLETQMANAGAIERIIKEAQTQRKS